MRKKHDRIGYGTALLLMVLILLAGCGKKEDIVQDSSVQESSSVTEISENRIQEEKDNAELSPESEEDVQRFSFKDVYGQVYEVTLNEEALLHDYDMSYLHTDGYFKTYDVPGYTSRVGIDVSKFQGDIDWQRVKDDGVEAAYIRLGYRGYSSGEIVVDEKYEDNISACNDIGLDCGVYFFTEALNEDEAREEADFCIENLGEYSTTLPIAIDVEESANVSKSRTKDLSVEQRTLNVIAFCERIREKGYEPIIYGNLKSLMIMTDLSKLEEYDKWFAYYHYPLRFPYKIKMWQYSATRRVDGIEGDVDLNLMFY